MDAFCSNTLSQTQCNGLTRTGFFAAVSVGLIQGLMGFILSGYLALLSPKASGILILGRILALQGTLYLIVVSLEASSRSNPGSLSQFLLLDKATAGLGILTLVLIILFQLVSVIFLAKQYDGKIIPVIMIVLTPLAGSALAFNIVALGAIAYEEGPTGIRAGARNISDFVSPSVKALALMVSFMSLTALIHMLLYYLLLKRQDKETKKQEERRRKAISTFSNSTIQDNDPTSSISSLRPHLEFIIPAALLAILKHCLAFLSINTIVAQRVIGLAEYTAYVIVITKVLYSSTHEKVQGGKFFAKLESNTSYASSSHSWEVKISPAPPTSPSILRRAGMASFDVSPTKPATTPYVKNKWSTQARKRPGPRASPRPHSRNNLSRMSYATQSAYSLAPEDSASTAAFLPRPPLPPQHARTRTTHGPNGSVLAPLREEFVQKLNSST